jgi:hypothetical protein
MRAQCSIYSFFEATTTNYGEAKCGYGYTQPKPNRPKPMMAKHYSTDADYEEWDAEVITCAHMEVPNV